MDLMLQKINMIMGNELAASCANLESYLINLTNSNYSLQVIQLKMINGLVKCIFCEIGVSVPYLDGIIVQWDIFTITILFRRGTTDAQCRFSELIK